MYLTEALDKASVEIGKTEKHLGVTYRQGLKPGLHRLDPLSSVLDFQYGKHVTQEADEIETFSGWRTTRGSGSSSRTQSTASPWGLLESSV